MRKLPNTIVLRPRFQLELLGTKNKLLESFESAMKYPFMVKRIDDHLFIKFTKEKIHFWSPQLHLEINEIDDKNCKIYGLFGPNPTLWTFFMFLHFGIAMLFIATGIWAYVNASLHKPYGLQIGMMVFLIAIWFAFYTFGRLGKRTGKPQMQELYTFMIEVLSTE